MTTDVTAFEREIHIAADRVSRELVGGIPAVTLNAAGKRVAKNDEITSFVTPAAAAADGVAGVDPAVPAAQVIAARKLTITKDRVSSFLFTGEEQLIADNGPGHMPIFTDQLTQCMRTLTNEMETDVLREVARASRSIGPASSTLFSADIEDAANALKVLLDNGAPVNADDINMVLDTSASTALRNLNQLTKVNEAGDGGSLLRQGIIGKILGFNIRESAQVNSHTKGTGASATTDNAGYSIGDTVITLDSAGTGTILIGDTITFAGDTNKYIVTSGDADVSGGGTITIEGPGLRVAMSAATKAITLNASAIQSVAFARGAIHLATRLPKMPMIGGKEMDSASSSMVVTDPMSGIAFEIRMYPQARQVVVQVGAVWGVKVFKPEHCVLLLSA